MSNVVNDKRRYLIQFWGVELQGVWRTEGCKNGVLVGVECGCKRASVLCSRSFPQPTHTLTLGVVSETLVLTQSLETWI